MNELSSMAKKLNTVKSEYSKLTLKIAEALEEHRFVYLTGKAGSGKSHNIKALAKYYKNTVLTATTGLSAINIGGETFHSFLCIDILSNLKELKASDSKNKFSKRFQDMQETLYSLDLLVIDEVSMMNSAQLQMVLYRLKHYPKLKLLLVGDFPQLRPVTGRPLYLSKLFTEKFFCIKLGKNYRQADDVPFQRVLDSVRNANVDDFTRDYLAELENNVVENTVKLRARNADVDEINELEIAKLETEPIVVNRLITYKSSNIDKYVLDGLLSNIREPETLIVKVGARVMITRNNKKTGVYNGDLGTVMPGSNSNQLVVKLDRTQRTVYINKTKSDMHITVRGRKTLAIEYLAMNVIVAYAMTIHKSQGLTLSKIDIDCAGIFDRHMFYVALSRATSSKGVVLHNTDTLTFTKNRHLSTKWYVK